MNPEVQKIGTHSEGNSAVQKVLKADTCSEGTEGRYMVLPENFFFFLFMRSE